MPDLRGADDEEVANLLPGVDDDEDEDIITTGEDDDDDDSGGGSSGGSSDGGSSGGGSDQEKTASFESSVVDAETGEVKKASEDPTLASETDSGLPGSTSSSTGTSDSGSGSSASSNSSEDVVNIDPINVPDRSDLAKENTDGRVAVRKSVTVEDQTTKAQTESGETVSRAELKQREARAEQRRRNLENQAQRLRERGLANRADELESQANQARNLERRFEDAQNEITRISKNNERAREINTRREILEFRQENRGVNPNNLRPVTDQEFENIAENVDAQTVEERVLPQGSQQAGITGEPPELQEVQRLQTQPELIGGTNIPDRSFLNTDTSATGFPGSPERSDFGEISTFSSPTARGFALQQETESTLERIGLDEQTSENIGRSVGATSTLALSIGQGVAEAPEDVVEFIQDPREKAEETASQLERANTGQLSRDPETAALLAGSDFQEQASLGREAVGGVLALEAITRGIGGIAARGAVRGVNAPTFGFRQTEPDIDVEQIGPVPNENRLSAADTEVGPEGQVITDQGFTSPLESRTLAVQSDDQTVGQTATGLQLFRVQDPEGERTIAADTLTGFRSEDGEVEGVSRTELIEIGQNNQLREIDNLNRLDTRVTDFEFDQNTQVDNIIQSDDISLSRSESASRGRVGESEFRALTTADIRSDRGTGVTRFSATGQPGGIFTERSEFGGDVTSNLGLVVDEERFEEPGITRTIRFGDQDEEVQRLSDLPEEQQRQLLEDLEQTGDEIFSRRQSRETDQDSESFDNVEEVDSGDQALLRESGSDDSSTQQISEVDQERLGIGTDQFASRSAREAIEDEVADEFSPVEPGRSGSGLASASFASGATETDVAGEGLTEGLGIGQDQDERLDQFPAEDTDTGLRNIERQAPDEGLTPVTTTDTDSLFRQEQPEQDPNIFRPEDTTTPTPGGRPPSGGVPPFDFDFSGEEFSGQQTQESQSSQSFVFQTDIESLVTGETQEVSQEELEQLGDQPFTGFEDRPIPVIEEENNGSEEEVRNLFGI